LKRNYDKSYNTIYFNEDDMGITNYDSSLEAWNFYQTIYQDMISERIFKFGEKSIPVSGDICFNFNDKKIKYLKEIVKNDETVNDEVKNQINELIDICNAYQYTPVNISVLPQTGGLNNTKQAIGNDRFDAFIWAMSMYFYGYKTLIKDNGSSPNMAFGNRAIMDYFLDSFSDGIQQFCKVIYQIYDTQFINVLIDSGSKSVDSCKRVFEYMQIAIDFWKKRAIYFCNNKSIEANYKCMNDKTEEDIENEFKEIVEYIKQRLL
jgi:hypothetical protein